MKIYDIEKVRLFIGDVEIKGFASSDIDCTNCVHKNDFDIDCSLGSCGGPYKAWPDDVDQLREPENPHT